MQQYQADIVSTRNVVERQYGVIKRRFPVLAYGMRVRVETAQKIVTAAAILHNICIDAHDPQFENTDDNEMQEVDLVDQEANEAHAGRTARDDIIVWYRDRN